LASPDTRSGRPRHVRSRSVGVHQRRFSKIEALEPDLVLGFSDLQADIAAELVRRGYPVIVFNQRSVAEILQMIRVLGGVVGRAERADALATRSSSTSS
jgi:ABC-type Fe3+-hydroxamate transport system substrate-binding protein